MKFTISSGPFNVPIVEHVVIVKSRSFTEARWNWEILKSELYARFPHLKKTRSYSMASEYDHESGMYCENVLIYIECDQKILKDVCEKHGGEYV
ncbi:hypothetical protein V7O67_05295 [Methanolobus sp. ZRKC4]|uniref:hypothetical protein n=1 Tax=Methanolobus sp. ZRKC4 TaxID=3125787 RepID=UPI0032459EA0